MGVDRWKPWEMFVNFRAGCTGRYQIGLLGLALKPHVRVWQVKLRMPMLPKACSVFCILQVEIFSDLVTK